jgi:uncharacterized protein YndB with AHSA1/START domain
MTRPSTKVSRIIKAPRHAVYKACLDPQRSPGGKTTKDTDTFQGRFVELVADEKIVEAIEFESRESGFAGAMKMTTRLADAADGTDVTILCEDLPAGIRPQDNETGTRQSLHKLAALLETG